MTEPVAARHAVEETEHLWVPMPDGTRLAARLWRPAGGARHPAILEIIPYRKRDMVRARDERNHPVFAEHGYASLRIDMRGSGDSEGLMVDMYGEDELADTRHAIEWIARQPWCDGRVGIFGTSWGGTAALQASVDAPKSLKAAIAVCATHDRYEDDIHHKGGCLITDTIEWGATLPAILASPPDAATVGPGWRETWRARLEALAFPLETWIREEARGSYWRRGSVRHRTEALTIPIFCVGGWSDRYSNSVMSLVDARPNLVWGLVGPWGHHYPDVGHPGPAVPFQQIALDWWNHWLKRNGTGDLGWPRLRLWLREFDPPENVIETRAGRWIVTGASASEAIPYVLHLARGHLSLRPGSVKEDTVPDDLRVGEAAGDTGYFGRFGGLPLDQAADDARSLVFETAPLEEDLILLGAPELKLHVRTGKRQAQLAVRLCDVAPDGVSCRIGLALRNLALDANFDAPAEPTNDARDVTIRFPTIAYRVRAGQRLRLAISSSYWPMAWPSPDSGEIRISHGRLSVPLLAGPIRPHERTAAPVRDVPRNPRHKQIAAPPLERHSSVDPNGRLVSGWRQPYTSLQLDETASIFGYASAAHHSIAVDAPLSAMSQFTHRLRFERPDGTAEIICTARVTCDAAQYHVVGEATASWNDSIVFETTWNSLLHRVYT